MNKVECYGYMEAGRLKILNEKRFKAELAALKEPINENTMEEIWKPVKGFEDYEVSNLGRVKSKKKGKESIKKLQKNNVGYMQVILCKEGNIKSFQVHRLVALAFLLAPKDGYYLVNHLDGNRVNNRVDNLEWSTHSLNQKHAYSVLHAKHPQARQFVVEKDGLFKLFPSMSEACRFYGFNKVYISKLIKEGTYSYKGFKMNYL